VPSNHYHTTLHSLHSSQPHPFKAMAVLKARNSGCPSALASANGWTMAMFDHICALCISLSFVFHILCSSAFLILFNFKDLAWESAMVTWSPGVLVGPCHRSVCAKRLHRLPFRMMWWSVCIYSMMLRYASLNSWFSQWIPDKPHTRTHAQSTTNWCIFVKWIVHVLVRQSFATKLR